MYLGRDDDKENIKPKGINNSRFERVRRDKYGHYVFVLPVAYLDGTLKLLQADIKTELGKERFKVLLKSRVRDLPWPDKIKEVEAKIDAEMKEVVFIIHEKLENNRTVFRQFKKDIQDMKGCERCG